MLDVEGFDIWRAWVDWMHSSDLGFLAVAIPSALWELSSRRRAAWAGTRREHRLDRAWEDYSEWCKLHSVRSKAFRFREGRFKKTGEYPEMTQKACKAAAARTLALWMWEVCSRPENVTDDHDEMRKALFECLVLADVSMRRCGRFMDDHSLEQLADATEHAMIAYNYLACEAAALGIQNWKVLPKMHLLEHSAYDMAPHCNPRSTHGYSDEDLVGKIKKIVSRCHPLTASKRGLERYTLKVAPYWYKLMGWLRGL